MSIWYKVLYLYIFNERKCINRGTNSKVASLSIRLQVFINIILIFVIIVSATILLSRFLILQNLETAEHDVITLRMEAVKALMEKDICGIDSTTLDWASWDDTYEFVEDGNQDYIEDNILTNPFTYLDLNLMVFLDVNGNIVYDAAYSPEEESISNPAPSLGVFLEDNIEVITGKQQGKCALILPPDGQPLAIASRPILPSDEQLPSRGTLVFGRYITESTIEPLNMYPDSFISMYAAGDENAAGDVLSLLSEYETRKESIDVKIINRDRVAGYIIFEDIFGEPSLLVRMEFPRDIYEQGRTGINYLILGIGSLGLLILLIVIPLTDIAGLSRLRKLSAKVDEIGKTGKISERVESTRNDEITSLSQNINNMLNTLQNLYEKEAELSRQVENELNRRVSFMRALVHELRTPLTPVLTTSEMLLERVTGEPDRSMVENVYRGAVRLNKRITELLDFTRSEVGGLEVHLSRMNPLPLIREAVHELEPEALQRKKSIRLEAPEELPDVFGDEDRIKQVLTNLVDNAIKYSVRGDTINVRVTTDSNSVIVEVEDHGPGIEEDDQKKMFTPYFRIQKEMSHTGGLGLGLQLSKNIVELHHGKIWLKSRPGEGSVFGFSIPRDEAESENK